MTVKDLLIAARDQLEALEARLKPLISDDLRRKMELDAIAEELK